MQRSRPGFSVHIDETADRRLILARMNDCHRRFHFYNARLLHAFNKLCKNLYLQFYQILVRLLLINELIKPPDIITYMQAESKLTRLQGTKTKRHKTDENWFKNISSRPLKTKRNTTISLRTETFYYTEPYTDRRYCIECWGGSSLSNGITKIHQGQHKEQNSFFSSISLPYQLQFN